VEALFWDTITQVRSDLAGVLRKEFPLPWRRMERNERGGSTLPPVVRHDPFMDQHALGQLGHHIVSATVPSPPTRFPEPPPEELLLELRGRIIRSRDRRRETRDDWDSLDSRGDWDGLEPRGDRRDEG
jgi:hypothetical protein